jgi:AcrR family transcriptional regulator
MAHATPVTPKGAATPVTPKGAATPVTPKGQATRAFILQIAAGVFAERGYADTTLSELIARSGLTKGAFYFHFASKEQLAFSVLEEKQRQWIRQVSERSLVESRAIDQFRALGPALIQLHRDDPSAFSASRLSRDLGRIPELATSVRAHMQRWIELVADIIARAQSEGDVAPSIDPVALATILVAATDGLKDLSDILDPPDRARRGFEQRMRSLSEIVDAAIAASGEVGSQRRSERR